DLLWGKFFCIFNEGFTRSMRTELKLFDLTTHPLRRPIRIESDFIARLRISQNPSRRKGIRIAHKKNRVLRIFDKLSRKNIRESFRCHHAARERINASGAGGCVMDCLTVQDKWRRFLHQLQTSQLPPAEMRAAIVNIGHLRTKAADINWEFLQPRKRPGLPAEFMKHRKHFLGLAQGENGNEHAAAACESTVNPVGQTALFS